MDFRLFNGGNVASLYACKNDWDGVKIALDTLAGDIQLVSGIVPDVCCDLSQLAQMAVIAGTVGKSDAIDVLIDRKCIDVSAIHGKWESYLIQVVEHPFDGIDCALVIAGSDKRGTIYGIYAISEMIGVSPWVYWADSVPVRKSSFVLPVNYYRLQGEPSVKYRGFFMNDEAPSLSGWLAKHFPKVDNAQATQGCGSQFYTKIFELLLRLKGNYLWPVMWNNSFHTDDPQNTILADQYGIVMGTSHHEHMTCADKEWTWSGLGEWNYATNRDNIYKFWQDGVDKRKPYESIITLGMRGQADTSILGENATLKANMELMQGVITDQREIIETVYGRADDVPQMIALYKEVEDFYYGENVNDGANVDNASDEENVSDGGNTSDGANINNMFADCSHQFTDIDDIGHMGSKMENQNGKLSVPDDVILMLCDDNFGNLRTLPTEAMRKHPGGFGMYYHFDYRGGPISYQWINQTPLAKIWDNMTTAYEAGIQKIWIVNVGDLKPMEFPLEYFMALAYDMEQWGAPNQTETFTRQWAAREFGEGLSQTLLNEMVQGIIEYQKILGARKAEVVLSAPSTFSLFNFDEANRVIAQFESAVAKLEHVHAAMAFDVIRENSSQKDMSYLKLPHADVSQGITQVMPVNAVQSTFYQTILYSARAAMNTYKTSIYAAYSLWCQSHGLPAANYYADLAKDAFAKDRADMAYFNTQLSGGKWDGIMRQNHMGYTAWDAPKITVVEEKMPPLGSFPIDGVALIESVTPIDSVAPRERTISVDVMPIDHAAPVGKDISTGSLTRQQRINAAEWNHVLRNESVCDISSKDISPKDLPPKTHIETNGYISINPANFASNTATDKGAWTIINHYGRDTNSLKVLPHIVHFAASEARPALAYNLYMNTPANYSINVFIAPANNMYHETIVPLHQQLRFQVQIISACSGEGESDSKSEKSYGEIKTVSGIPDGNFTPGYGEAWTSGVMNNVRIVTIPYGKLKKGLYCLKIQALDAGVTIQKIVIAPVHIKPTVLTKFPYTQHFMGAYFGPPEMDCTM